MALNYDWIILNGVNLQQSKIGTEMVTGLGDPAPHFESGHRVQAHGSWATRAYLEPRNFTIKGWVQGANSTERDTLWWLVQYAASISDVPLTIVNRGRLVTYKVRRVSEFNVDHVNPTTSRWQFTVTALNPIGVFGGQAPSLPPPHVIKTIGGVVDHSGGMIHAASLDDTPYSDAARVSVTTTLPQLIGGFTFPAASPFNFNSQLSGGKLDFENPGDTNAVDVILTIKSGTGVLSDPQVKITSDGGVEYLVAWKGLDMAPGQVLTVYVDQQYAMLDGYNTPPTDAEWPIVEAGGSTLEFSSLADCPGASVTLDFSPAM